MKMIPCECNCGKTVPYGTGKRKYWSDECRAAARRKRRVVDLAGTLCANPECGKKLNDNQLTNYAAYCGLRCKRIMAGLPEPTPKPPKKVGRMVSNEDFPAGDKGNATHKIRLDYCKQRVGGYRKECKRYPQTMGQGCYDGSCYQG